MDSRPRAVRRDITSPDFTQALNFLSAIFRWVGFLFVGRVGRSFVGSGGRSLDRSAVGTRMNTRIPEYQNTRAAVLYS